MLLELLESGEFVSGQRLCEALKVSRTAVWKIIGQLRAEGYRIEAVTNRGYRLLAPADDDILNETEIARRLHTQWAGHPLVYEDETGSTNEDAQRLADEGAGHGTLVAAGRQTAGRGRRGRAWVSPPNVNIYMSILLRPGVRADQAPMLTLVMALAAADALEAMCADAAEDAAGAARGEEDIAAGGADGANVPGRFGIKWPNDIVVLCGDGHWRKIAGILTEMRLEDAEIRDVVVGTGINVNMIQIPEEIAGSATSVLAATGRRLCRAELAARIWQAFEELWPLYVTSGDLRLLRERYETILVNRGRRVRVLDPQTPFEGTAQGITDRGELIVYADGEPAPRTVGSGEISVRGVEGYV